MQNRRALKLELIRHVCSVSNVLHSQTALLIAELSTAPRYARSTESLKRKPKPRRLRKN
jgi:hypothetical protein